ncbi:hypothetical protein CHS0354_027390 [Potamilus streckersoni]|uniref:Peptidase M1 alanyl aminopeptidase C-terminal domain-containing protein n=1 Tax=Potamilus streckersoni TaxID=2493646 RepID=A0AAE0SQ84_9BIVA|nr:hypothetical protein CHS0354_027390 [Potamilus streckersoni]
MAGVLKRQNPNDYYNAYYIGFPSYSELFAERTSADPDILREAYKKIFERCWRPLEGKLVLLIEQLKSEESKLREEQKDVFAIRELKNTLLAVLTKLNPGKPDAAINAYEQSQHITDLLAAFRLIMLYDNPARTRCEAGFLSALFSLQPDVLQLDQRSSIVRPCRAVAGLTANIARFHDKSGTGYRFLRDLALRTDKINPMLSAVVITKKFNVLSSLEPNRRALCQEYLRDIVATDGISPGMREVAEMLLKN